MTPEQIAAMSALADTLAQTADAVTAANTELASIELALKGHRASIETLFDREREIKSARNKLVEAMEAAEAGLEKFESMLPDDAIEIATSVDEESGLAELVDRMHDDGGFPVDGQPGSFPDQEGSMADDVEAAIANVDGSETEVPAVFEDSDLNGGRASEAMLNELDADDGCGSPDPEHSATMQDAVDGLAEVSEEVLQDVADTIDAGGPIDVEVVKVSADDIERRAAEIPEGAAGQIANSTKIGA